MKTVLIEGTNGTNYGKFLVGEYTDEWDREALIDHPYRGGLLSRCGWDPRSHFLVQDLQTGEGSIFALHGVAKIDLDEKHKIWVCPLFESFLTWLYATWRVNPAGFDIELLPTVVQLDAPFEWSGYRRRGRDPKKTQSPEKIS